MSSYEMRPEEEIMVTATGSLLDCMYSEGVFSSSSTTLFLKLLDVGMDPAAVNQAHANALNLAVQIRKMERDLGL